MSEIVHASVHVCVARSIVVGNGIGYLQRNLRSCGVVQVHELPTMYLRREYREVLPDTKGALKYFINVKENHIDTAEKYISDYCDNINPGLDYTSRETYMKDFNETINTFLVVGGALSAILALIAILNMINLTYTSIHERKQELSVLGAIGMTQKQIAAMLSYEGILRVLLTFALVLTIGQLLNYAIVYLMAGSMIMFSYKYVVWPMLVCIPVFLIIAALIPRIIWRKNIS